MLYTLSIWAVWLVLAAFVGGVVGWLLRSIGMSRRDEPTLPSEEIGRLRGRVAELEAANLELQRAQRDLAELSLPLTPDAVVPPVELVAERDDLARKLAEQQHWVSELRVRLWNSEARNRDLQAVVDSHIVAAAPPDPDLAEGERVLGVPVRMNDLTVIEGIGPAIAHLCINRGFTTWWSMANADLSVLRSTLAEAGPKFQVHDPTSWPQQARLLANGDWERFARLAQALRDGNAPKA